MSLAKAAAAARGTFPIVEVILVQYINNDGLVNSNLFFFFCFSVIGNEMTMELHQVLN